MPDEPKRAFGRRAADAVTSLAVVGLGATAVVAMMPIWPLELFEHFRVQYIAVGLLVSAAAFALRLRGYFDAAAIATLVHLCSLLPTAPRATPPARGTSARVLVLNVHTTASSFEAVRQLIADTRPDLLALVEVDQRWLEELAPALTDYPGRIHEPRTDNFGIALFARGPITGTVERLGSSLPSIVAQVPVGTASLSVIVTHPLPPVSTTASAMLDTQLAAIADRARGLPNVLVMGDLNATPWSRPVRRLLARSGLCDSRDGFGLQPTFPASPWILRIPIDHLLHACTIGVTDRRVERDVGSDHLPVVVDLVVPSGS
jgi:endonuclease/exonuclease/phosphatase (EEP) superfamily protein YafD